MRGKADQRFRYGIFLGRCLGSDQNFVGLSNGDVVRARAIVRLVPESRWDSAFALRLKTTPLTESTRWLDGIEQTGVPHQHSPLDNGGDGAPSGNLRRVKITLRDLQSHGFTDGCPRCVCHRNGQHRRARFHKHTEGCRQRIYDALLKAGSPKIQFAPSDRVQTNSNAIPVHQEEDAPHVEPPTPADDDPEAEALFSPFDDDDQTNFHEEVNDDLESQANASGLVGEEDQEEEEEQGQMVALMDILQCLGVATEDANGFAASVVRNKPRFEHLRTQLQAQQSFLNAVVGKRPTFVELYGRGKLLEASHGCRRNLNIDGLRALDPRTHKKDGTPWDFNLAADRQEALMLIDTTQPTWVIGSPPCTPFSKLNVNLNFPKMAPEIVREKIKEGIRHLHFVISIYRKQLNAARHFLHEHPQDASSWDDPAHLGDWITSMHAVQ